MTKLLKNIEELKAAKSSIDKDKKLSFVPTMGALHEGHMQLVRASKKEADVSFVSVFVNPLQFGPSEDFDAYPRILEKDLKLCEKEGVDFLFAPEEKDIYPEGDFKKVKADLFIANRLCGLSRPGHFDGVCTVVKRLFDLIKPDISLFGEKDYQQFLVIKEMTERLDLGLELIPYPTVRDESGLALSSRNEYLSKEELEKAPLIYRELNKIKDALKAEKLSSFIETESSIEYIERLSKVEKIISESKLNLGDSGFKVEYLELFENRVFVAAKLGETRLIDNLELN